MEFNIQFTYDQVLEIVRQMPVVEREKLLTEIKSVPSHFDKDTIDSVIDNYHSKFENTYKALA